MNSATLSTRAVASGSDHASALQQLWQSTRVTFDALFSVRHQLQQFDEMQRLLRESNGCAATNSLRSAALRAKAFELID